MPEKKNRPNQENEARKFVEQSLINSAKMCGFNETEQLRAVRSQCDLDLPPEKATELIIEYQNLAREVVLPSDAVAGARAQLGLNIACVAVIYRCGFWEDAADALNDALDLALNLGASDIASSLLRVQVSGSFSG